MNTFETHEKLIAEGCSARNFAINSSGSDVYCLCKKNGEWSIFYTERGIDHSPIFSSVSESEACKFFYDYIMKMEHWHIVGFYKCASLANAMESKLSNLGIRFVRNDLPAYQAQNDPRFRIFVVGKDIFRFKEEFGEPCISYA
ncbi:SPOR domain-containing protein [Stutzerimonas stutzeri]|jgi:hypothetical protein|uniref:SPOR domain-containing protein n=1 Tax=Stutzerimonas stutzeri TaxID=316 RepID=UPI00210A4C20|nr:SPOR domain-containing protein [Stutzerimonas stutzeri]MCQ4261181.1 SPOR domain-containing protein [Stutzerimonas stutzeri]